MNKALSSLMLSGLVAILVLSGCSGSSSSSTPDTTPPTVLSTSPTASAQKAAVMPVTATFSEGMDGNTLTAASFVVSKGGIMVTGSVSTNGSVATFTPSGSRLDYNALYSGLITTAAKDLAGNSLVSAKTWTFTTKTNLDIKAGGIYTVALQNDGSVWTWGENTSWGMGRTISTQSDPVPAPITIPTATTIKSIETGNGHTIALDADSKVYAWGTNGFGQLGDGSTTDRAAAVLVSMPSLSAGVSIDAVAASSVHTLVLTSDGKVYAWGHNAHGELGDGTTTDKSAPVSVPTISSVVAIAAGDDSASSGFSLALLDDGTIWGWGTNADYQLAHDTAAGGCGAECFDYTATPVQLHGLSAVRQIAAGYGFGVAVDSGGKVYTWGDNTNGQLGNGSCGPDTSTYTPGLVMSNATTTFSGASRVAAGRYGSATEWFVLTIKTDGTVWGWGSNVSGVLGDGTTGSMTPNCLNYPTITNLRTYPVQAIGLTNVTAISTGEDHSIALTSDGTVWAWGENTNNLLGLDPSVTANPVLIPTQVPNF